MMNIMNDNSLLNRQLQENKKIINTFQTQIFEYQSSLSCNTVLLDEKNKIIKELNDRIIDTNVYINYAYFIFSIKFIYLNKK